MNSELIKKIPFLDLDIELKFKYLSTTRIKIPSVRTLLKYNSQYPE